MTSQKLIIAIATLEGLILYTLNIDNAYLNGVIDTKLYMKQPKRFQDPSYPVNKSWVCELAKGLYGGVVQKVVLGLWKQLGLM